MVGEMRWPGLRQLAGNAIVCDLALIAALGASSAILAQSTTGNAKLRFFYGAAFDAKLVWWWIEAGAVLGAVLLRRRWAAGAYVVALTATVLHARANLLPPLPVDFAVLLCLFTVGDQFSRAVSAPLASCGVIAAVFAQPTSLATDPFPQWHNTLLASVVLVLLAWTAGDGSRSRRAYLAEVHARALEAERERALETELAVGAERGRIARELHDIVAHGLSVMVVQAQGASAALEDDPSQTGEALHSIVESGRQALADMRRLLRIAREPDVRAVDLLPAPGVEQLPTLVEQMRRAGVPVRLTIAGHAVPLDPLADLLVFRVIQEALTNVIKHAGPGATSNVNLTFADDHLDMEIVDSGAIEGESRASVADAGYGLAGMTERVRLLGGSLDTGPRPDGGFRVHARIPVRGAVPIGSQ